MSDSISSLNQATLVSDELNIYAIGHFADAATNKTGRIIGLNYSAGLILDDNGRPYIANWSSLNIAGNARHSTANKSGLSILTGYQVELFEHACPVSMVASSTGIVLRNWSPFAMNGSVYIAGMLGIDQFMVYRVSYIDGCGTKAITYPTGDLIFLSDQIDREQDLLARQGIIYFSAPSITSVHMLSTQDLLQLFGNKDVWAEVLGIQWPKRHAGKLVNHTKP
jgi:hypothetical protein